jgi:uncharacterized OB-fold protein
MQATYRPGARLPAAWLDPGAGPHEVPVAWIDEDEATMAVAAAEALLARAGLAAHQLRRIVVSSRTRTSFGATLATALRVPMERVEEAVSVLYGATQHPAPGEGPVLFIQSDAVGPGRVPQDGVGSGAAAVARLTGAGLGADAFEVPVAPFRPDQDAVAKAAQWEHEAPRRTTMGAHVPKGTWDRSAGARYRLEAGACPNGHVEFPPRPTCGACGTTSEPVPLPREGTVETFTIVAKGAGPSEFDPLQAVQGEYGVVVARFGPARVPGLVADADLTRLRVGLDVAPVFRRLYGQDGEWRYGLKFRPWPSPKP